MIVPPRVFRLLSWRAGEAVDSAAQYEPSAASSDTAIDS